MTDTHSQQSLDRGPRARRCSDFEFWGRVFHFANMAIVLVSLLIIPVIAQAHEPGGTIFGADPTVAGEGVRQFVRWFRNIVFLFGVAAVGFGCIMFTKKKEWGNWILGGALCLGFGTVAAVLYAFVLGNPVDVNTDLGN